MTQPDLSKRASRQSERIPPAKLERVRATVIGVGAIGRQVALQIAAIGVPRINIFDNDEVAVENLCCQGYWESDLGKPKVEAVKAHMLQINSSIRVDEYEERFSRLSPGEILLGQTDKTQDVVFCCVDSIETRGKIYESVKVLPIVFIDARMAAETFQVLAFTNLGARKMHADYYGTTIFPKAEVVQEGTCAQQSTIHNASAAAAYMVQQLSKFLRDMPMDRCTQVDLLAGLQFAR